MAPLALKTKITTPRLDETRAFYERLFDLVVAEAWDDPGDRGVILALSPDAREALLEIHEGPEAPPGSVSLQFKVHDLEAFRRRLPADLPVAGPTPRPWGSTYLYLRDPNGIAVVVFEGGL
ncbi:MAG: VOC family protein [Vicinamibacterales bacterium]